MRQDGATVRAYSSTCAVVSTVRSKSESGFSMEKATDPPPAQWTMTEGISSYRLSSCRVTLARRHPLSPHDSQSSRRHSPCPIPKTVCPLREKRRLTWRPRNPFAPVTSTHARGFNRVVSLFNAYLSYYLRWATREYRSFCILRERFKVIVS